MQFQKTSNNDLFWLDPNFKPHKDWAVFLDRDGVVIKEVNLLSNFSDIHIFSESFEAIKLLNDLNISVFLTTNQTTVCRELVKEDFINQTHEIIQNKLNQKNAHLDGILTCLHHPDANLPQYKIDCNWRKPNSGMFEFVAQKFNLNLKKSYGIGDKARDILAYKNVGIESILVNTGYAGEDPFFRAKPGHTFKNILDSIKFILEKDKL